jgi:hypothetical protein
MVNGFPELVYEDKKQDQLDLGPNATSLDLLRAIYRSPAMPLHTRMRAAISCLQHEHPKLGITFQASESDFAELLDRRIKRYQEMKMIEHQPTAAAAKPPMPAAERMRRRI